MTEPKYPKCQLCGHEISEGVRIKRIKPEKDLFLCRDCECVVHAVAHDSAYDIFSDIATIMGENVMWEERLQNWQSKKIEAKPKP